LTLHQLSESSAYRTGRWVVHPAHVALGIAYGHSTVFRALGVMIIVVKAERDAGAMSWVVGIARPMGVIA